MTKDEEAALREIPVDQYMGLPRGAWIDICLMYGVYKYPKIQVRMPYPRHTETEWTTVETIRKSNAPQVEELWDKCTRWDCCVRMTGLRGEVVREMWPIKPFGSPAADDRSKDQ